MARQREIDKTEKAIKRLELEMEKVVRTDSILNRNQAQKMFLPTPDQFIYDRPSKGGGKDWKYVRASYVRQVLDSMFGFNWDFEIKTTLAEAFEVAKFTGSVIVEGRLTCRTKHEGQWHSIVKENIGRADVKFKKEIVGGKKQVKINDLTGAPEPLDFGNDFKSAATDCLKRCASILGIAGDIYSAEEWIEIHIIGAEGSKAKDEAAKKRVEAARKTLKAQSEKVGGENE